MITNPLVICQDICPTIIGILIQFNAAHQSLLYSRDFQHFACDYLRCAAASAHLDWELCVSASRLIRDLPRALDVRDQNLDNLRRTCSGKTTPSSQESAG
jgi:hypothetical protein